MLALLTSVRHPHNSVDYDRVEDLLRRSLASVYAQTVDDYVVVVVCNRRPAGEFSDAVHFVEVDFPPPSGERTAVTGREAVLLDKGTKLAVALVAAQAWHPDYVMKFDADDFISRRIAATAATGSGPGWVVQDGWVLSDRTGLMAPVTDFHTRCGTSEIVANHLYDLPTELPAVSSSQDELVERLGEFTVSELLGSHRRSVEHFAALGAPLVPLPYPGAVYSVANGENHSGRAYMGLGRPVSRDQAAEFGLTHARGGAAWLHWSTGAIRAVGARVRHR